MRRRLLVTVAAALGVLVFSSTAGAEQLGITQAPSAASTGTCFAVILQATSDTSTPYTIPTGGGLITQWQTWTVGDTAGSNLTLLVLQPTSSTTWTVAGESTETIPSPLPTNHIASFTLSTPIRASAGDTLALYSSSGDVCWYEGGATPSGDALDSATGSPLPPAAGQTVTYSTTSGADYALNVGATLAQTVDAGVQTSTFPSTVDVASGALLSSVVTNSGPDVGPITFVDQLPSGLQIKSASTAGGTCAVSGQTVTCAINGLPVGESTTVNVVVMAAKAGRYAADSTVSVASGLTDPNAANNSTSATLVFAALPQQCIVPGLRKAVLASARTLLKELGCRVRVVDQPSSVKKGLVISVRGGVRAYPYQQLVTLLVSSGKKAKKKK
jgi:hypothetical protein